MSISGIHSTAGRILQVIMERANGATIVDEIEKVGYDREEVIKVFLHLQSMGLGTFIRGRRGHLSRFEWAQKDVTPVTHRVQLENGFEARLTLPSELSNADALKLLEFIQGLIPPAKSRTG